MQKLCKSETVSRPENQCKCYKVTVFLSICFFIKNILECAQIVITNGNSRILDIVGHPSTHGSLQAFSFCPELRRFRCLICIKIFFL